MSLGFVVLPIRASIPAQHRPLRAIYVNHEGDAARLALVSDDGLTFTLPDNWLSLYDLQAVTDAVDTRFGRPASTLVMSHAMRRAVLMLMDEHQARHEPPIVANGQITLRLDPDRDAIIALHAVRDCPARTIRVELTEAK